MSIISGMEQVSFKVKQIIETLEKELNELKQKEQAMQEQMEGSEYLHKQAYEELTEKIEQYIKECNYTCTVKDIFEQYRKCKQDDCCVANINIKDVVENFRVDLDRL